MRAILTASGLAAAAIFGSVSYSAAFVQPSSLSASAASKAPLIEVDLLPDWREREHRRHHRNKHFWDRHHRHPQAPKEH